MKKLFYVKTSAYDMLVTYDEDTQTVRFTSAAFVYDYINNLEAVEDDSSWELVEDVEDFEKWLGIDYSDPTAPIILSEIDFY